MKQKNATPTASAPSIFYEASGSICFVFQDAAAPDAAHALLSFKDSNNRRQNHRKHCLPQDWLTFSWLDVWLLNEFVKFAIDYCWHGTIKAVSIFPLWWRLALMKLDHDDDLEKRRQLLNWNQNHRWVTLAFNNFHNIAMKYLIPMKILLILQKMK